jgi:hypothetical protein
VPCRRDRASQIYQMHHSTAQKIPEWICIVRQSYF